MIKQNKKGFTLVELVIVIAVIAILAGVLIGTFATVISRANQSKAVQEWRATVDEAYVNYVADAHDVPTSVKVVGNTVVFGDLTSFDSLENVYPLTQNITIVLNAVKGQEVYFNWVSNEQASTYDIATSTKNTVSENAKSSAITEDVEVVKEYVKARLAKVTNATYFKFDANTITFSTTAETGYNLINSATIETSLVYNGKTWSVTFTSATAPFTVSSVNGTAA